VSVMIENTQRAAMSSRKRRLVAVAVLMLLSAAGRRAEIHVTPEQQSESGKVFAASSATIYFEVRGAAEARGSVTPFDHCEWRARLRS
jgi:hypothetical protein